MLHNSMSLLCCGFLAASCAKETVRFEADEPLKVSIVKPNAIAADLEVLGTTPVELAKSKFKKGSIVKLTAPGKVPLLWTLGEFAGERMVVRAVLPKAESEKSEKDGQAADGPKPSPDQNLVMRTTVRAYKALFEEDWAAAEALAKQVESLTPNLAISKIIYGVSRLNQGDQEGGRKALVQAKSLDPNDPVIDSLLETIQ